jgi:TRAP-type mannitol/chloroaromatic compound transport system permease small subunit
MTGLVTLATWIDYFSEKLGKALMWLVLIATAVSSANAIMRYGFNQSSNAWLEIQWYMFSAMFLLAAGYTLKRNEHVRVDVLFHRYRARTQHWVDLIGGILFLLPTALIIMWLSWPMFWNSIRIWESSADAGGLLRWPVKIMVPIGFALLAVQAVAEIIKRLAVLTGHSASIEEYHRPVQ